MRHVVLRFAPLQIRRRAAPHSLELLTQSISIARGPPPRRVRKKESGKRERDGKRSDSHTVLIAALIINHNEALNRRQTVGRADW